MSKDSRTTAKTLETQENDLTKSGIVMPKKTITGTSHMEWTVSLVSVSLVGNLIKVGGIMKKGREDSESN